MEPRDVFERITTRDGGAFPRRRFLRGAALSAAGLVAAGELGGLPRFASILRGDAVPPKTWSVPEAAYVRAWGLAGAGPCSAIGDQECATGVPTGLRNLAGGLSVPGLGIPLGGVGAGAFHYNLFGTFGPWNMGGSQSSNFWEMRTLPEAAFHIREEVEGAEAGPTVKTLATRHDNIAPQRNFGGVLPAWSPLSPGDGTYAALYPFGWTTYKVFQSNVSMRFWSPIVAGEDERTSMPVAFFDVELANLTGKVINLSVMFTFPNATSHSKGTTRAGLYSRFDTDGPSGVGGVTLGSDSPTNTPDAHKSEWTIAALPASDQKLTYVTSWNGSGDGSDIYRPFSSIGRLPNEALDGSNSAGAVAVAVRLLPGRKTTVRFALSWDFPQVYYGGRGPSRAIWMRRYTEFLGARSTAANDYVPNSYPFQQAFNIAKHELARHDDSLTSVEAWWKPIAENPKYPVWLRKAALNELFEMVFNASFWETGLVSSTIKPAPGGPRLGAEVPGTHLFYTIDAGSGGAGANELDVDSFGYLCYTKLFPNLERGRVRAWLQMIKQNPYGRVPQQFYPGDGPFIAATSADQGAPTANAAPIFGAPPPAPSTDLGRLFDRKGGDSFRDCPHKVIYRAYALYKETDDESLVSYGYAPMLKALKHVQFFRPAGSHLPADPPSNNPPNTYDQIVVDGHGIYNSQLYLLSLQILSTLTPKAMKLGVPEATPAVQTEIDTELAAAKAEFEKSFWNPKTERYRFCDGTGGIRGRTGDIFGNKKPVLPPDVVFLDSFYAQCVASQLGLPDLIDLQRARTHWNNTLDAFLAPKDAAGKPIGPPVMLDVDLKHFPMRYIQPPGRFLAEIGDVWPGTAYMATAAAVHIGRQTGDGALIAKALKMSEAVANQIFDEGGLSTKGYAFGTPESWFVDDVTVYRYTAYARARSVWQLVDALDAISGRPRSVFLKQ
jgi:non-lysosomal glucosylceramidase